ncbi:cation-transporting P-type ATPase PCA1 [Aspergillus mulundensis]|uniref:Putative copper-transporting ATPase n=1 Tax=Aspergillus mulundensis TaxID=1810919 RepID=A0A3D8SW79_9EURO|nr:putative copper-transporting ATPase [Aspergillus mulundensis]RDW90534.1 putative copper-transporting ATPase [Aspergillus mulundensis]
MSLALIVLLFGNVIKDILPDSGRSRPDGKACDQHRRSARAKFAARLEALGCICRTLIALGQESCCPPPNSVSRGTERRSREYILRSTFDSDRGSSTGSINRRSAGLKRREDPCTGGCCSTSKTYAPKPHNAAQKGKRVDTPEASADREKQVFVTKAASIGTTSCSKGCCGRRQVATEQCLPSRQECCNEVRCSADCSSSAVFPQGKPTGLQPCASGCCNKLEKPCGLLPEGIVNIPACPSSCCDKDETSADIRCGDELSPNGQSGTCCSKPPFAACGAAINKSTDFTQRNPGTFTNDPEKGITGKEHVALSISGMTCTGCETKLQRTLGTLQSVQNLKTSLLLSRAEFDLDVGVQSLDEVLRHLEKTTEFKYERVTDRGLSVDIIVPNASDFMKQDWPHGVTEVTLIDEETVNVAFDGKIVGARDLLERGWDRPLCLAAPRPDSHLAAGNKHVRQMGYMTVLSIILTVPVLVLAWAPLPKREIAYGSASLALATVVQVVIAGPFYPKALKALIFSKIIEMDLLIVLSTSAAYIFSVVSFGYLAAGQPLATGEFFETSTLLITLIMIGRYVAALARQKAVESISLRSMQTSTATLVDEAGATIKEIDVRLLQYGDIFKVPPDSKIPTDGTVIAGLSEVNESLITGESIPVDKSPGSSIVAGSVNGSGSLIARLTRLPADNTISVISRMVDQAKLSKPKIQDMADRVASYFVPVVIALTMVTFAIWIAVGITVQKQSGSRATAEAITYTITVLIVSCPCAIGLAVPMVIVIASGVAAERGVIFKAANSIEVAYKSSHVIFDKTGTLTQGRLTVAVEHIDSTGDSMSQLLGLIGSNKHPISAAVAARLKAKGIIASTVNDIKVLTGKGVEGSAQNLVLRAGNSRWLNLSCNPQVQSILEGGYTAFCFTINETLVAVFGLEDSLRPDALETVTKLQERGISVHILSGDDQGPVSSIARQLGITDQNIRSRCTPSDKQAYIQALNLSTTPNQATRKNHPVTIFIGDGTNDAVALAAATIGVHMNQETGSEIAKSAADAVLMRPHLLGILTMLNISEKAVRRIKFNFAWSFVYNLFAVLLGAGAFKAVGARIPPQYAGLGELVSVLPVVVAAVLLRWARI